MDGNYFNINRREMTNTNTSTHTNTHTKKSTGKVVAWMDSWGFSPGEEKREALLWSESSYDEAFVTRDIIKAIGEWKALDDQRLLQAREISEDLILTKWETIPSAKNRSYHLWYTLFKRMEFSEFIMTPHDEILACDSPENGWSLKTYQLYR